MPVIVPCVGAVVRDDSGRLLLVRRGHPPAAGRWSLPGGRVEPGETATQALAREVREETGLAVTVGALLGSVRRPGPGGVTYEIADYDCAVRGGDLLAGDDAAAVGWFTPEELAGLSLTGGLLDALTEWQVLGPDRSTGPAQ